MGTTKSMMKWPKQITPPLIERLMLAGKDLERAITVFESATAEYANGFRHDQRTFSLMIKRLLSANRFAPAEDMLARMKQENCNVNEEIFQSIYRAFSRVHKPLEVVRVFRKMEYGCEPTTRSYVTVFSILVDESHLKMEKGIQASLPSVNVLIIALCNMELWIQLSRSSRRCRNMALLRIRTRTDQRAV